MRKIFVPQLDARVVRPILRQHRYRLPENCEPSRVIARWHYGTYYGYGTKESWIPLSSLGGMATKPFRGHTVRFPLRIDRKLQLLLKQAREGVSR